MGLLTAKVTAVVFMRIISVIDGDSLKVDMPPDCIYEQVCKNLSVRLVGFDTPETHQPHCPEEKALGLRAMAMTKEMFKPGDTIVLSNLKKDKYGRLLAEAGALKTRLIAAGLAIPYEGGHKDPKQWCK